MASKDSNTKPELLPCPFCGGLPNERISKDGSLHVIECINNDCFFQPAHKDYLRYKEIAVEAWNRRA